MLFLGFRFGGGHLEIQGYDQKCFFLAPAGGHRRSQDFLWGLIFCPAYWWVAYNSRGSGGGSPPVWGVRGASPPGKFFKNPMIVNVEKLIFSTKLWWKSGYFPLLFILIFHYFYFFHLFYSSAKNFHWISNRKNMIFAQKNPRNFIDFGGRISKFSIF